MRVLQVVPHEISLAPRLAVECLGVVRPVPCSRDHGRSLFEPLLMITHAARASRNSFAVV